MTDATINPENNVPCPRCEGSGRIAHRVPGVPASVCRAHVPCPACWPRDENGDMEFWSDGRAGWVTEDQANCASTDPTHAFDHQQINQQINQLGELYVAARAWVAEIADHPNQWSGEHEKTIVRAIRRLDPDIRLRWLDDPTYEGWPDSTDPAALPETTP